MPTGYPLTTCKICDRPIAECGSLSYRGKCQRCGHRRIAENHYGLTTRSGPYWRLWRKRMAASVGGVLLDDDGGTG